MAQQVQYQTQANLVAYAMFCAHLKEVAAGTRDWISLSNHSKLTGIKRQHLEVMVRALDLKVERYGKYGYCAVIKA